MVFDFTSNDNKYIAKTIYNRMQFGDLLVISDVERGREILSLIQEYHDDNYVDERGKTRRFLKESTVGLRYQGNTFRYKEVEGKLHIWRIR